MSLPSLLLHGDFAFRNFIVFLTPYFLIFPFYARYGVAHYRLKSGQSTSNHLIVHIVTGLLEAILYNLRTNYIDNHSAPHAYDLILCFFWTWSGLMLIRTLPRGDPLTTRPAYQSVALYRPVVAVLAYLYQDPFLYRAHIKALNSFMYTRLTIFLVNRSGIWNHLSYSALYGVCIPLSGTIAVYEGGGVVAAALLVNLTYVLFLINRWVSRRVDEAIKSQDGENSGSALPSFLLSHFLKTMVFFGFAELPTVKALDEKESLKPRKELSRPLLSLHETQKPLTKQTKSTDTDAQITIDSLRRAIPEACFQRSLPVSMSFLLRDVFYMTALTVSALHIAQLPSPTLRILAWVTYGILQGLCGTGLWVLAHECGHGAFSSFPLLNDIIGFILHSLLLVPYFSWKITHARHHRFLHHMNKDVVFTPEKEDEFKATRIRSAFRLLLNSAEDAPVVSLVKLMAYQLFSWPLYTFLNVSAGSHSLPGKTKQSVKGHSHFNPYGALFLPSQAKQVFLSDIGLGAMLYILYSVATTIGWWNLTMIYIVPYLWVHHWMIAITFLHHTHPDLPFYGDGEWTFLKGALSTTDRDFGFVGRHFFHNLIDHHLVHHLFPQIPFHKARLATEAITPLLGGKYLNVKDESFIESLFRTFRSCLFVTQRSGKDGTGVEVWDWSGSN